MVIVERLTASSSRTLAVSIGFARGSHGTARAFQVPNAGETCVAGVKFPPRLDCSFALYRLNHFFTVDFRPRGYGLSGPLAIQPKSFFPAAFPQIAAISIY